MASPPSGNSTTTGFLRTASVAKMATCGWLITGTVSNVPKFSQRGGMIQFVVEANKVRFEVNLASAERAGLSLSSELLKVATTVTRSPQPGD